MLSRDICEIFVLDYRVLSFFELCKSFIVAAWKREAASEERMLMRECEELKGEGEGNKAPHTVPKLPDLSPSFRKHFFLHIGDIVISELKSRIKKPLLAGWKLTKEVIFGLNSWTMWTS